MWKPSATTSARLASSPRNASAGGHDEQPCEVNSSTTIGRVSGARVSAAEAADEASSMRMTKIAFIGVRLRLNCAGNIQGAPAAGMSQLRHQGRSGEDIMDRRSFTATVLGVAASPLLPRGARAADPLRIGLGMAQTGPLAANGKSALIAMDIWKDDINAKGGVLGRPVEFVIYDDQSNPATVPGIYTKLLDVDKVDLVVSGYGTNVIAPAMPVIIQHNRTFLSLFGLAVNSQFHYPKYFTITPTGVNGPIASTIGFFEVGAAQNPPPKTLAIVAADAEYPKTSAEGVRTNAKKFGWDIVYDK